MQSDPCLAHAYLQDPDAIVPEKHLFGMPWSQGSEQGARTKKDRKREDRQQQQEARLAAQQARENKTSAYDERQKAKLDKREATRLAQVSMAPPALRALMILDSVVVLPCMLMTLPMVLPCKLSCPCALIQPTGR